MENESSGVQVDVDDLLSTYDAEIARLTRRLMFATSRCAQLEKRVAEFDAIEAE